MKKFLVSILTVIIIISLFANVAYASTDSITVIVNGSVLETDAAPFIANGRTLVPLRAIVEALNLDVLWIEETKSVFYYNSEGMGYNLFIGSNKVEVGGAAGIPPDIVTIDAAPVIVDGRTFVPVRFIAESLNISVDWDGANRRVIISSTNEEGIKLMYTDERAYISRLYTTDATGEFNGFKQLHGYPCESSFSIYYKGSYGSYQVTSVDIRNLDPNYTFQWTYNGVTYKTTRKEAYSFFSDTAYLSSRLGLDNSFLTHEWFKETFGEIYTEWMISRMYSEDALRIVNKYLMALAGVNINRPESNHEETQKFWETWVHTNDLTGKDIELRRDFFTKEYGFIRGGKTLHKVPDMTDEFMEAYEAEGVFSGILMRKYLGQLIFLREDLIAAGIIDK